MTDKQRAAKVLELLAERYPDLETHLMAESPWELLVATVLAAQCTDKRVNQVTPELFRRWPDPAALAQATIPELEEVIHSVGFYHSKAKHLIAAAQLVVKEFNGETPNTMKDLIKLPGVARKTANVVLWGGFGMNTSLATGLMLVPLLIGIGLLFFLDRKWIGWVVTAIGLLAILVTLLTSVRFRPVSASLWQYVVMFGMIAAGCGLVARGLLKSRD